LKLKADFEMQSNGSIPAIPKYLQHVFKYKMVKGESSYTEELKDRL